MMPNGPPQRPDRPVMTLHELGVGVERETLPETVTVDVRFRYGSRVIRYYRLSEERYTFREVRP